MSGCQLCPSRETFVESGDAWVRGLPDQPLCRPCALREGRA